MSARNALYQALMADGIPGTGHTPDRSIKASALIDAVIVESLSTAAVELLDHCPIHGTTTTAFITCQCPAADHLTTKEQP